MFDSYLPILSLIHSSFCMYRLNYVWNEFRKALYFPQVYSAPNRSSVYKDLVPTSSSYSLYKCIWFVIVLVILIIVPSNMAPVTTENSWENAEPF